jgi:hypothetical protein
MDLDKPHFLSEASETGFYDVKDEGPFKSSKEYPTGKHCSKHYQLVVPLTHYSFFWIVPLNTTYINSVYEIIC